MIKTLQRLRLQDHPHRQRGLLMYLLLFGAILLFGMQTVCFKEFTRRFMQNKADYFFFSGLYFLIVVVLLLAINGFRPIQPQTWLIAVPFGILFILAILLYMRAMEVGSLSFSALVFSFGLLVPVLAGQLFWGESISLLQVLALVVLLASFYLAGGVKLESGRRFNVTWLVLILTAMLGNGVLMTLSKYHQRILPGRDVGEFLIVAFATAALASAFLTLFRSAVGKERISRPKGAPFVLLVAGAGVTTAFGNWIALHLAGNMPAVLLFPVMNGGIVFASSVLSVLLFKEKMTRRISAGMALGLAALVMISLG